jgi:hypothetical protein
MSNPNMFNNNLQQTTINDAYHFESFSTYINNKGLLAKFSPICIFCSGGESIPLTKDGSFRQCNRCKKQFKAKLYR